MGFPVPDPRVVPIEPSAGQATPPERPWSAPITSILIGLNALVFMGQVWMAGLGSLNHMPTSTLLAFGANRTGAALYEGRFETLLSSCFVHGSALHIGFNMIALRQVGPFVERAAGRERMLPLYLASGIVGSVFSTFVAWLSSSYPVSCGASGAICGLIGAALILGYRLEGPKSPVMRSMARWLATLLALGFSVTYLLRLAGSRVGFDNAAHIGGAIAGMLIASIWQRGFRYEPSHRFGIYLLSCSVLVAMWTLVYRHDVHDPLAFLDDDGRREYARQALESGRCAEAASALAALQRLSDVDSNEVAHLVYLYRERCPRRTPEPL